MFDGFRTTVIDTPDVPIHVGVGGDGPPLLLLHGYPQTAMMWHRVAPALADRFTVVVPDLRGYGRSGKPPGDPRHVAYSKRAMAADQVAVMRALGFERFKLVGHDRGARVAHRLAMDHAGSVERMALLDIVPTLHVFETVDQAVATGYFHWFFLIQPDGLPERMIGADPEYYLRRMLGAWSGDAGAFDEAVVADYVAHFRDPASIHATCEDYRAGATIDLEHDRADRAAGRKLLCPLLVLWGSHGLAGHSDDPLAIWRRVATDVRGYPMECGHFLAEERPRETLGHLMPFLAGLEG